MSRPKGSPKTPGSGKVKGSQNKKTKAIRERLLREEQLTVEATVEAIRRGQQYDARRLFTDAGTLRPIHDLSEEEAWCIAGFEVVIKNAAAGDGHTDTVHKIKLVDRGRYVELAAKHQGMLTEKVEVSGSDALLAVLAAGRERVAKMRKA